MQVWEIGVVQDLKTEVVAQIDRFFVVYTDIVNNAAQKLFKKLHSICPVENPAFNLQKLRIEVRDLVSRFESNNYKENDETFRSAEEFFSRYTIQSKTLTMEKCQSEKLKIGDIPEQKLKIDPHAINFLFEKFLPELLTESENASDNNKLVSPYSKFADKIYLTFKDFTNNLKSRAEENDVKELLVKELIASNLNN